MSSPSRALAPHYIASGLRFGSDIALHGLALSDGDGEADVEIALGEVPARLDDLQFQGPFLQTGREGAVRYETPGVAAFLIEGGSRITVAPEPGIGVGDFLPFLLGPVFGILFHQRGLFPLHAATVEIEGRAIALAGVSGAGKSTLAAALTQRGFRLLADDVSVISIDEAGDPVVAPSMPRQGLWQDSLEALAIDPGRRIRHGEGLDKFERPLADAFQTRPVRLAAICTVMAHQMQDTPPFEEVGGAFCIKQMRSNIYRLHAAQRMGLEPRLFAMIGRISPRVRHFSVRRPQDFAALPAFVDHLLASWREALDR